MNNEHILFSPDQNLELSVSQIDGRLNYSLKMRGQVLIRPSCLALAIKDERVLGEDLELESKQMAHQDETSELLWGQNRWLRNHYNELHLTFKEVSPPCRRLGLRFRLFDDGLAFRYEIPEQPNIAQLDILQELTEFRVEVDSKAWWIPSYQSDRYEYLFQRSRLAEMPTAHTPLTLQLPSGRFAAIHEAALYDYGSLNIKFEANALRAEITPLKNGLAAQVSLPIDLPWRTFVVGEQATDLIKSDMTLRLNKPPANQQDFAWVKPLKFIGIWWGMFTGVFSWGPGERQGANTANAIKYIDACKELGIKGLLIEGWNEGWEGDWMDNGAKFKFTQPVAGFDIQKVAAYAQQNGVELIGHHETSGDTKNYEAQLPAAFEFYKELGIRYVKTGYVGPKMDAAQYHHSQYGVRHYQKIAELAAQYEIMLDIHEPIKDTGISRTWPNILTREGGRGQEYEGGGIDCAHLTILPFTRLLAGPMDYTPGIFDVSNYTKRVASTLARQLAMYVVIYSPMQMAADLPEHYFKNPAFKFIHDVPIDWQKSLPLAGEIGQFIVMARQDRSSDDWFIGGLTNERARQIDLKFTFLDANKTYHAEIYRDGINAHWRDHQKDIIIEQTEITADSQLTVRVAHGGGFAIRLRAT